MDVTGEDFLAGAALAGDQDRGVGGGHLIGELDDAGHQLVAHHEVAAFLRHRGEHGGDQVGVGRQGDVFLGAGADGADRGAGVVGDAAGDHGDVDQFDLELLDQIADVEADVDHQEIGALAGAQRLQGDVDRVGVADGGAAIHGDARGDRELAAERSDDEEPHAVLLICPT